MHNLKEIRKNFEFFKKALEKRSIDIDFDKLKDLDQKNREFIQKKRAFRTKKERNIKNPRQISFCKIKRNFK